MEEPMFVVGDKAVCINSQSTHKNSTSKHLIEGKIYTITYVYRCRCGHVFVSVGISDPHTIGECGYCSNERATNGVAIHVQNRFMPLQTDRALESEIFEALKGQKIVN